MYSHDQQWSDAKMMKLKKSPGANGYYFFTGKKPGRVLNLGEAV